MIFTSQVACLYEVLSIKGSSYAYSTIIFSYIKAFTQLAGCLFLSQFFAAPSCVFPLSTFICEVRQFFPSHYIRAFPYNFSLIIFKRKILNDQIPFLVILLPDVLSYHLGPLSFFEMQQLFLHYFHTSFLIIAITDLSQTQRLKITHLLSYRVL